MNEVEKMYSNAGIKKEVIPCPAKYYGYDCTRNNWDDEDCSCDIEGYPPFTAEKQLELIKWLAKTRPIHITFLIDKWVIEGMVRYGKRYDTFEFALSGYVNNLWQDLTDTEKAQIKEILECITLRR